MSGGAGDAFGVRREQLRLDPAAKHAR
jgi:hypothetical protein